MNDQLSLFPSAPTPTPAPVPFPRRSKYASHAPLPVPAAPEVETFSTLLAEFKLVRAGFGSCDRIIALRKRMANHLANRTTPPSLTMEDFTAELVDAALRSADSLK